MNQSTLELLMRLKTSVALSRPSLEKLADHLTLRSYEANETIFSQGEEAKWVYLMIAGVARVSFLNSDQRETTVNLLPAGEFFGLDSLSPGNVHPFACNAFDDSTVGLIQPRLFVEAILNTPYENFLRWYNAVMLPMQQLYVHCIRGIGLDLHKRLALELLNLANRFGSESPIGVELALNISHENLAGIMGASRQQVTQHLNQLDREKCLTREGRRIIVDRAKLAKIAGCDD